MPAGWLVAPDKDDPKRRLLLPIKNNLAADVSGLAFSILDGALAWEDGPVMVSADDALAVDERKNGRTERDDTADWLRELLADGPIRKADVDAMADENGISPATLRRAKSKAGARSRKHGIGKDAHWTWELPKGAKDAQAPDVSTFDTFGPDEAES